MMIMRAQPSLGGHDARLSLSDTDRTVAACCRSRVPAVVAAFFVERENGDRG